MDIDLIADPNLLPKPRREIKIERLTAAVLGDATRVRVEVETTPFAPSDRPNIELTALAPSGDLVASVSIIETMQHSISLTMHLRDGPAPGTYRLQADLSFGDAPTQHSVETTFELPATPIQTTL